MTMEVEAAERLVMPWGTYKDYTLESIPSDYLKRLADTCNDEQLCAAADVIWRWREKYGEHI